MKRLSRGRSRDSEDAGVGGTPEADLRASEPAAFAARTEALYARYSGYVATIIYRIWGTQRDLEDAVHDVFVESFRALNRSGEPEHEKAWIRTITVRLALAEAKRRRRAPHPLDDTMLPFHLPSLGGQQDKLVDLWRRLRALSPDVRAAWALAVIDGVELLDAARLCGCSLATVKRRVLAANVALGDLFDV